MRRSHLPTLLVAFDSNTTAQKARIANRLLRNDRVILSCKESDELYDVIILDSFIAWEDTPVDKLHFKVKPDKESDISLYKELDKELTLYTPLFNLHLPVLVSLEETS